MKSHRDKNIKQIRPALADHDFVAGETPDKHFFNTVIKPVLELQAPIITAQFRHYTKQFKPVFNAYNKRVQRNYIQEALHGDPRIRNSLIASVVSLLTLEEYDFYCTHKRALNDLIIAGIISELDGQVEKLL